MVRKITLLGIIFLLIQIPLISGTTGKIKGQITDKSTGEPIIGANVIVDKTNLGAATDVDGNYFIINISPGTYTLVISYIGYQRIRVSDIEVQSDRTTIKDFELSSESIETEEVIVSGKRTSVEKDRTNTAAYISSQQIDKLPVQELDDILQLQTGVVRDAGGTLHMRGGRGGEIAYLIDGVSVTDQYRGGSSIGLENSWVQELQVISGTFNAEYGQAQSGIVNIVTKDGADKFGGKIILSAGDYVSSHKDIFMNINDIGLGEADGTLNLFGPTGIPKTSFYTSTRYYRTDGWLYGQRVAPIGNTVAIQNYIHEAQQNQTNEERLIGIKIPDSLLNGDRSYVALNPDEKISFYGKISSSIFDDLKLSYSIFYNKNEGKSYSDYRRYSPDGVRTSYGENYNHILNINHVLSLRTFYSLSLSNYSNNQKRYLFVNPLDANYQGSPYAFESFAFGGTDNARSDITNASYSGKIDVTSQVDNYNLIKLGGEFKLHKLKYQTLTTISDGPVYENPNLRVPAINTSGNNFYEHSPIEAALYLQDKLELSELIVNGGVRVDYWDPKAPVLVNARAETKSGDGIRLNSGLIDAEKILQVSPRFGLAYPISENGVVHVSYGHFFQLPKFSYIFANSEFEVELGGLETTMGNANLKPEKTISYEAGLQQQVGDILNLDFTLYYKDIRNLLSQEIINTIDKKVYARYTNRDYGNVKGFIISLRHNSSAFVNGALDYTFQIAKGNASDPNAIFVDFQSNPPQESEKQVLPLAWDQRHTLNASLSVGNASDWNMGIIGRFSTGQPYTPSNPSSQLTTQFENSGRKPFTYNIDINLYKMVNLAGYKLKLFCKIFNLTDRLNELYVYSSTGSASEPYRTRTEHDLLVRNPNLSINEIDLRPDFYSEPRRIIIGFSVDF